MKIEGISVKDNHRILVTPIEEAEETTEAGLVMVGDRKPYDVGIIESGPGEMVGATVFYRKGKGIPILGRLSVDVDDLLAVALKEEEEEEDSPQEELPI